MPDKVKSVAEVVRSIPDGSHIALGGFAIARNAIVFAHEVIRQQKKNLTLSQGVMGMETDLLVGAGLVSKIIVGGGSLDRFGPVRCINRARDTGAVVHIDSSSLSLAFGYLAGALGISFIPIKSLLASEMMERLETAIRSMAAIDQEIIAMRHFEDLTNVESAEALGISPTAASNRYVRAIARLKEILTAFGDSDLGDSGKRPS